MTDDPPPRTGVAGILLAAGGGRRMGRPKALVATADGTPWVVSAVRALRGGGCDPVLVAVGAEAAQVRALLSGEPVRPVEVPDWSAGMAASFRAALGAAFSTGAHAALVHLVDLPDVDRRVIARLRAHGSSSVLARADFGRGPAHPVLIGRDHWAGAIASAEGDQGARAYFAAHDHRLIDCSDLATGEDVDHAG